MSIGSKVILCKFVVFLTICHKFETKQKHRKLSGALGYGKTNMSIGSTVFYANHSALARIKTHDLSVPRLTLSPLSHVIMD